ncbi:hypothetical protein IWX81_001321 [Salinibacterium sp. CAN_S4]
MQIPNLGTDTIANEVTTDPASGIVLPLQIFLRRNLGIALTEILSLDALASDCAIDGQWDSLYVAGPLKIRAGSAHPVHLFAHGVRCLTFSVFRASSTGVASATLLWTPAIRTSCRSSNDFVARPTSKNIGSRRIVREVP